MATSIHMGGATRPPRSPGHHRSGPNPTRNLNRNPARPLPVRSTTVARCSAIVAPQTAISINNTNGCSTVAPFHPPGDAEPALNLNPVKPAFNLVKARSTSLNQNKNIYFHRSLVPQSCTVTYADPHPLKPISNLIKVNQGYSGLKKIRNPRGEVSHHRCIPYSDLV